MMVLVEPLMQACYCNDARKLHSSCNTASMHEIIGHAGPPSATSISDMNVCA